MGVDNQLVQNDTVLNDLSSKLINYGFSASSVNKFTNFFKNNKIPGEEIEVSLGVNDSLIIKNAASGNTGYLLLRGKKSEYFEKIDQIYDISKLNKVFPEILDNLRKQGYTNCTSKDMEALIKLNGEKWAQLKDNGILKNLFAILYCICISFQLTNKKRTVLKAEAKKRNSQKLAPDAVLYNQPKSPRPIKKENQKNKNWLEAFKPELNVFANTSEITEPFRIARKYLVDKTLVGDASNEQIFIDNNILEKWKITKHYDNYKNYCKDNKLSLIDKKEFAKIKNRLYLFIKNLKHENNLNYEYPIDRINKELPKINKQDIESLIKEYVGKLDSSYLNAIKTCAFNLINKYPNSKFPYASKSIYDHIESLLTHEIKSENSLQTWGTDRTSSLESPDEIFYKNQIIYEIYTNKDILQNIPLNKEFINQKKQIEEENLKKLEKEKEIEEQKELKRKTDQEASEKDKKQKMQNAWDENRRHEKEVVLRSKQESQSETIEKSKVNIIESDLNVITSFRDYNRKKDSTQKILIQINKNEASKNNVSDKDLIREFDVIKKYFYDNEKKLVEQLKNKNFNTIKKQIDNFSLKNDLVKISFDKFDPKNSRYIKMPKYELFQFNQLYKSFQINLKSYIEKFINIAKVENKENKNIFSNKINNFKQATNILNNEKNNIQSTNTKISQEKIFNDKPVKKESVNPSNEKGNGGIKQKLIQNKISLDKYPTDGWTTTIGCKGGSFINKVEVFIEKINDLFIEMEDKKDINLKNIYSNINNIFVSFIEMKDANLTLCVLDNRRVDLLRKIFTINGKDKDFTLIRKLVFILTVALKKATDSEIKNNIESLINDIITIDLNTLKTTSLYHDKFIEIKECEQKGTKGISDDLYNFIIENKKHYHTWQDRYSKYLEKIYPKKNEPKDMYVEKKAEVNSFIGISNFK